MSGAILSVSSSTSRARSRTGTSQRRCCWGRSPLEWSGFLDLGTGDGRLLALIRDRHPDAMALGIDNSDPMLARAAERFDANPLVELRAHDLELPLTDSKPLDAVVSGLAIHHLEDERKRELFGEIHLLLAPGGVFANLDLVASASPRLHERFRREIGRTQDDPTDRLVAGADLGGRDEAVLTSDAFSSCGTDNASLVSGVPAT